MQEIPVCILSYSVPRALCRQYKWDKNTKDLFLYLHTCSCIQTSGILIGPCGPWTRDLRVISTALWPAELTVLRTLVKQWCASDYVQLCFTSTSFLLLSLLFGIFSLVCVCKVKPVKCNCNRAQNDHCSYLLHISDRETTRRSSDCSDQNAPQAVRM